MGPGCLGAEQAAERLALVGARALADTAPSERASSDRLDLEAGSGAFSAGHPNDTLTARYTTMISAQIA
jgi:hypothetical protein